MSRLPAVLLFSLLAVLSGCSRETPSVDVDVDVDIDIDIEVEVEVEVEVDQPVLIALQGQTMGTGWSVQIPEWYLQQQPLTRRLPLDMQALESALLEELERINALMSTWNPDSELSRFNRMQSIEPAVLDPDTLTVIDTALRISVLTQGRYDITLAPVIELWGFGPDLAIETPDEADINAALALSGYRQLVRTGNTLRKRQPGVRIDLSSLAKGYAVDQLGRILEGAGIEDYLLEIGGELRSRGHRSAEEAWRVGIETPDGVAEEGLALGDAHVASSGSYRNYREEGGRRLSHIIDGQTGRPIEHALVAVTVLHESTMLADAWATALLVVGEQDARRLIAQQALAAQLTERIDGRIDGRFVVYRTPSFESLVLQH